jgi:hypothetical protein
MGIRNHLDNLGRSVLEQVDGEAMRTNQSIHLNKESEARFWSKVSLDLVSGCWIWGAYVDNVGYGNFGVNGKTARAHAVSWTIFNGKMQAGMVLDHICNNRRCVNPDHLRLATHTENQRNQKLRVNNTCGFKGVYFDKRRGHWVARVRAGRVYWLGSFGTPTEAHAAYCEAAVKHHGEFANFGVVNVE